MRLSWYADSAVAVFSIWHGNRCTGTFRLPFGDLARMAQALQSGPSSRSAKTPGPPVDAAAGGRSGPAQSYPQTASYPVASGPGPAYPGPAYPAPGPGRPAQYPGPRDYPDRGYPDRGYHDSGYPGPGYPDPGYPDPGYPDPGYPERSGYQDRPGHDYAAYDGSGYRDPPGYDRGDYQQRSGHEASRYQPDAADYSGLHSGQSDRRYDGGAPFGSRQPAPTHAPPVPAFGPGDHARGHADPALASSAASGEWLTAPTGTTRTWRPSESADDGQPSRHSEHAGSGQQNTDWEAATASYRAL
jgi:hypothetical protein